MPQNYKEKFYGVIENRKYWLIIGTPKNWKTALSQTIPIWGWKEKYHNDFNLLQKGDFLLFYSSSPVKGIIGIGLVKEKYIDYQNLVWPEEINSNKVIWPLRFRIQILRVMPSYKWNTEAIKINDIPGIFWQTSFNLLNRDQVNEIISRSLNKFGNFISVEEIYKGPSIIETEVKESIADYKIDESIKKEENHKKLQEIIAEIGKLQYFYSELEFPIHLNNDTKRLDVVWKREVDGVPTYSFEIELSFNFERAIEKLKIAYIKWNSLPRLIVSSKNEKYRAENLISHTIEKNLQSNFHIISTEDVLNLYEQKRKLRELEEKLKIY